MIELGEVADDGGHVASDVRDRKQAGRSVWRERIAHQFGTELLQPERHPAAFKAGVPGEKNFAAMPE